VVSDIDRRQHLQAKTSIMTLGEAPKAPFTSLTNERGIRSARRWRLKDPTGFISQPKKVKRLRRR
jgi:hypothetical protein